MDNAFPGLGTVINVVTIVVGSLLGMAVGHRLPERTRLVVTDCLGLTTLLVAGLSAVKVTDVSLSSAVGSGVPVLIVLGSLLIGGISGSLMRIEGRLERLAGGIQARLARRPKLVGAQETRQGREARERFIEGWLSASLLFCVGPLTILGSLSDGLGKGIDQLTLKAVLDGFRLRGLCVVVRDRRPAVGRVSGRRTGPADLARRDPGLAAAGCPHRRADGHRRAWLLVGISLRSVADS
jgi:uncharacterized membrane protein YqgA involved in biofilm formation